MNTITYLIWLVAALLVITLAPHPLYMALVFLAALLVFSASRNDSLLARSYGLFLKLGAFIFGGYLLFSLITVGGMRGSTVLLALPSFELPAWLGGVVLGGPVTAEALAWGATRGLQLWTLLVVFGTFNALVDHYRLLRLTPRSLFHAGLAVTIAVAFVPSVLRSISTISEAQRARGHRFRGLRSWLPLAAPLLTGSLEKAVQLAESLESRGYGRTELRMENAEWRMQSSKSRLILNSQFSILAGLVLLIAGLFGWLYYGAGLLAAMLMGGGALALLFGLRTLGRQVQRSSYRRERWRQADTLVVLAAVGAAAVVLALRLTGHNELVYYPFPTAFVPGFDLRVGLATMLLAAPALVARPAEVERRPRPVPRRETPAEALPSRVAVPQAERSEIV